MVSDICGSMELDTCIGKAVRLLPSVPVPEKKDLVYVHPNSAGASVSPKECRLTSSLLLHDFTVTACSL